MQMSPTLTGLFNRQITMEFAASIAYLQMAAYLESQSLSGMASWMRAQSEEERAHGSRFVDFVLDRGNEVEIGTMDAPKHTFDGPTAVFTAALAQEQAVTATISEMYIAAQDDSDIIALPLLQEFLSEQVEEEATFSAILDRLALAGSDGAALLEIDRELADRQG